VAQLGRKGFFSSSCIVYDRIYTSRPVREGCRNDARCGLQAKFNSRVP